MKTIESLGALINYRIPVRVVSDYAIAEGISDVEAFRRARELEKFLYLCAHSGQSCVPSPPIDSIWHDFILHTLDYEQFCFRNFGRFIHHKPSRDISEKKQLRNNYIATVEALREFGQVDDVLWPHSEAYLNNQACCGNCAH